MIMEVKDVVLEPILNREQISECLETSLFLLKNMEDRPDLHDRGVFERFTNIAMGEIAERAVIEWLLSKNKYAVSAVDKHSEKPDKGFDILLKSKDRERELKCSVKSSLSIYKSNITDILKEFTISTKKIEVTDINIQVYFWLNLNSNPRITLPSELNMGIIGWLGRKDLQSATFGKYSTENREAPKIKLQDIRPMESLLGYIS